MYLETLSKNDLLTTVESFGLTAPDEVPAPPGKPSIVGAIELSKVENLLAIAQF
jgi:hypothetical protein